MHPSNHDAALTLPRVARSIAMATLRLGTFAPFTSSDRYEREIFACRASWAWEILASARYVDMLFMPACSQIADFSSSRKVRYLRADLFCMEW